jgi:hypothetical protein
MAMQAGTGGKSLPVKADDLHVRAVGAVEDGDVFAGDEAD